MKVKELIKRLSKLDEEMEVVVDIKTKNESGYTDVIECDTVLLINPSGPNEKAVALKTKFWIYDDT